MFDISTVNTFLDGLVKRMVEDFALVSLRNWLPSGLCFEREIRGNPYLFFDPEGKMSCKDAEFLGLS